MGAESIDPQTDPEKAERIDKSIEKARAGLEKHRIVGKIIPTADAGAAAWMPEYYTQESQEGNVDVRNRIAAIANEGRGLGDKVADKLTGGEKGNRVDEIAVAQYEAEKVDEVYDPEVSVAVKEAREKAKAEKEAEYERITAEQAAADAARTVEREAGKKAGKVEVVFSYDITDISANRVVNHIDSEMFDMPEVVLQKAEDEANDVEWGQGGGRYIQSNAVVTVDGEAMSYNEFGREMRKRITEKGETAA